jgi:hypothetical protein
LPSLSLLNHTQARQLFPFMFARFRHFLVLDLSLSAKLPFRPTSKLGHPTQNKNTISQTH